MRVIAGSAGGRRLDVPAGTAVRPTADRVREALFSSLGPVVPDAAVLDLFAGSGALGIEALSRGAALAVLVERDRQAAAVAARNLTRTGLHARATLLRADAATYVRDPRGAPFDIVLLDPPYEQATPDLYALVTALREAGGLAPDATVVLERDRRDATGDDEPPRFLALDRRRVYGDTVLLYLRSIGR